MSMDKRRPAEAQSQPKLQIYLSCRESTRNQPSSFLAMFFKEVFGIESQHKPDTDTWVFSSLTEQNNPGAIAKRPWNNNKNPQTTKPLKSTSSAFAPVPFKDCFYSSPLFTLGGSHKKFLFCMVKKNYATLIAQQLISQPLQSGCSNTVVCIERILY